MLICLFLIFGTLAVLYFFIIDQDEFHSNANNIFKWGQAIIAIPWHDTALYISLVKDSLHVQRNTFDLGNSTFEYELFISNKEGDFIQIVDQCSELVQYHSTECLLPIDKLQKWPYFLEWDQDVTVKLKGIDRNQTNASAIHSHSSSSARLLTELNQTQSIYFDSNIIKLTPNPSQPIKLANDHAQTNNDTISILWQAPTYFGSSAISHYIVAYHDIANNDFIESSKIYSNKFTISPKSNSKIFYVKVMAFNQDNRKSVPSEQITVSTTKVTLNSLLFPSVAPIFAESNKKEIKISWQNDKVEPTLTYKIYAKNSFNNNQFVEVTKEC